MSVLSPTARSWNNSSPCAEGLTLCFNADVDRLQDRRDDGHLQPGVVGVDQHPVFLAALERATAFGRWRSADVRSILAAGTGTPQPRPAGAALVIDLPTTAGRSLVEYAPAATAAVSS